MLIRTTVKTIEILGCPTKEELHMWAYNSGNTTELHVKLTSNGTIKGATNFHTTSEQIRRYVEAYLLNNNRLTRLKHFHMYGVRTIEDIYSTSMEMFTKHNIPTATV